MAGYPGTISSAWQQAGRAGRRAEISVAVLVASALPLDQYLIAHPRYFFGQPVEQALLDPDNLAVLANHLACAAFELPFKHNEPYGNLDDVGAMLDVMVEEDVLHRSSGRYTWIGEGYPAGGLSLRTSTPDNVVIQDVSVAPPQVIGQVDRPSAPVLIHEGAAYLHGGETYIVDSLDWEEGLARVRVAELDYYTRASSTTDVRIVKEYAHAPPAAHELLPRSRRGSKGGAARGYGKVLVTTRATGYRKIKRYTHEMLTWAPIDLPEQGLRTTGYWISLSEELTAQLQEAGILPPPTDYGPNWSAQRDSARARDGYVCRHCGAPEREDRKHDVHHITPFRAFGYVPGINDFYLLANQLGNLITLCLPCHRRIERMRGARGALSGLAYLLRNLAPLHLMCDPSDLGSATGHAISAQERGAVTGQPSITLYDRAPGGAGLSVRLYELHDTLLKAALDTVRRCPCADGCPGCVGPAGDVEPGTKSLTRKLLETIAGE
jgi:DEAD/DEAH box helicase domain-containing protein